MLNDLRYAIRTFLKTPGFAVVATVTLALGIGANTAIFSVVNGVLLRALPFPDSDRIVRVWTSTADEARSSHSAGDFVDLRREQQSLVALAGYARIPFSVAVRPGEPSQLIGAYVTAEFFDVLGAPAAVGRRLSGAADGKPGERKVVLSTKAWQQLYNAARRARPRSGATTIPDVAVVGVRAPRAAAGGGRRVWVDQLFGDAAHPGDRHSHRARRAAASFSSQSCAKG